MKHISPLKCACVKVKKPSCASFLLHPLGSQFQCTPLISIRCPMNLSGKCICLPFPNDRNYAATEPCRDLAISCLPDLLELSIKQDFQEPGIVLSNVTRFRSINITNQWAEFEQYTHILAHTSNCLTLKHAKLCLCQTVFWLKVLLLLGWRLFWLLCHLLTFICRWGSGLGEIVNGGKVMIDTKRRAMTYSSFIREWDNRAVPHHTLITVIHHIRGQNICRYTFTFSHFSAANRLLSGEI